MARTSLLLLFLFGVVLTHAQYNMAYLVEFTDKNNSVYSIDRPEEFLSQRAIDRRTKQSISISEEDFPVNSAYINGIVALNGAYHNQSKWLNSAVFYSNAEDFKLQVEQLGYVQSVQVIFNTQKSGRNKFDAESVENHYGNAFNQINMLNGQALHNVGHRGKGIHIGVLDSGFSNANDLEVFDSAYANNRILGTYDFVENTTSVYEDHYHGTSVLSVMAANIPNQMVGTAPEASYWLLRTEDVNSEFPIEEENWISAAEFADSVGCDIITTSLGYYSFDDASMDYEKADMDGLTARSTKGAEKAFSKGMLVVSSAGNEGNDLWGTITVPSDGEHVLTVGAVEASGLITAFSSRGPSADGRVKPDVVAQGGGTTIINTNGTIVSSNGTSFSCPLIAGMAACLWQGNPDWTNQKVLQAIRASSNRYNYPTHEYGYGIPDFAMAPYTRIANELERNAETKVYPNPFTDNLYLNLGSSTGETISVQAYNMIGKQIFSFEQNTAYLNGEIALGNWDGQPSGIYTLVIYSAGSKQVFKVIKK